MYKAMLLWFLHNGALPAAHHCQVTQIPTFAILKVGRQSAANYLLFNCRLPVFHRLFTGYLPVESTSCRFWAKKNTQKGACWRSYEARLGEQHS